MNARFYKILSCDEESAHRYRLDVLICPDSSARLVVVQLNPSTANTDQSDPTIGKVSYWAREQDFGAVAFINLFALRTPHPKNLVGKPYEIIVGTRNDDVIRSTLAKAETVVFAWGRPSPDIITHYQRRLRFLKEALGPKTAYAVGAAVKGEFPRHGRMWNGKNRRIRLHEWL